MSNVIPMDHVVDPAPSLDFFRKLARTKEVYRSYGKLLSVVQVASNADRAVVTLWIDRKPSAVVSTSIGQCFSIHLGNLRREVEGT